MISGVTSGYYDYYDYYDYDDYDYSSGGGLSGGAIAGIVIGCVVGFILFVISCVCCCSGGNNSVGAGEVKAAVKGAENAKDIVETIMQFA